MKKFIIVLILIFTILGCNIKPNYIDCKGLSDNHLSYCHMYFRTHNEGYLVANYTLKDDELKIKLNKQRIDSRDVSILNNTTREANIYKTTDGGKNWVKIDSIIGYLYTSTLFVNKSSIFLDAIGYFEFSKRKIVNFDIMNESSIKLKYIFENMGLIWAKDSILYVESRNNKNQRIYALHDNLSKIDSIPLSDSISLKDKVIKHDNDFYSLTWKKSIYNISTKNNYKLILNPDDLAIQDKNKIIIAGNSFENENEVLLVSYDVKSKNCSIVKEFNNYAVVSNLSSNDKAIVCFLGNYDGHFLKYDLCYSLDKGLTWKIKELNEPHFIFPVSLLDNVIYIFTRPNKIQKIELV